MSNQQGRYLVAAYDEGVAAALTPPDVELVFLNPYYPFDPCWHAWWDGYNS